LNLPVEVSSAGSRYAADQEKTMKSIYRVATLTLGTLALAFLSVTSSSAECGGTRQVSPSPSGWHFQPGQAQVLQTALASEDAEIVGFWHVKFVSKGSEGIPDGTEVDAGYSQWHADGTEIMNSGGRSPITGAFCLGVWKKVGDHKFKLNHFAAAWDSTGGNLIGPAQIREQITLAPNGNKFSGTFTIDQYDESQNRVAHVQGIITGTRIEVDTAEDSIF
jgi:hypothetical protein